MATTTRKTRSVTGDIPSQKGAKRRAMRVTAADRIATARVDEYWPADRAKVIKTLMTKENMSYGDAVTWSRRYMKRGQAV